MGEGGAGGERAVRSGEGLRILVAAFGDAGHAFPAIALARALAGRGHRIVVETWERWRDAVEGEGLEFAAAQEYRAFPPPPAGSGEPSVASAARGLLPLVRDLRPHVVVHDVLTLAPALAAEVERVPRATLVPHVYPESEPGMPFFAFGLRPPRTAAGRALWRAGGPLLEAGLRRGRRELNETRAEMGLRPLERFHGGTSEELVLVATFPGLEYPRRWPAHVRVTGPMEFERPHPDVEIPEGEAPLVLVAPSTAQDPEGRLVRMVLEALADEPVRVLATMNRLDGGPPLDAPANAVVVDWLSYSQVMPEADVVVCHGGHGTVCRALAAGVPLVCSPAAGDMAENSIRVAWAGAGVMVPRRLAHPAPLRLAVRRVLGDRRFTRRAAEFADWATVHDGTERGAVLVEKLAAK